MHNVDVGQFFDFGRFRVDFGESVVPNLPLEGRLRPHISFKLEVWLPVVGEAVADYDGVRGLGRVDRAVLRGPRCLGAGLALPNLDSPSDSPTHWRFGVVRYASQAGNRPTPGRMWAAFGRCRSKSGKLLPTWARLLRSRPKLGPMSAYIGPAPSNFSKYRVKVGPDLGILLARIQTQSREFPTKWARSEPVWTRILSTLRNVRRVLPDSAQLATRRWCSASTCLVLCRGPRCQLIM